MINNELKRLKTVDTFSTCRYPVYFSF